MVFAKNNLNMEGVPHVHHRPLRGKTCWRWNGPAGAQKRTRLPFCSAVGWALAASPRKCCQTKRRRLHDGRPLYLPLFCESRNTRREGFQIDRSHGSLTEPVTWAEAEKREHGKEQTQASSCFHRRCLVSGHSLPPWKAEATLVASRICGKFLGCLVGD